MGIGCLLYEDGYDPEHTYWGCAGNASLESIDGLSSLTSVGDSLLVGSNPHLPSCQVEALVDRLRSHGWDGELIAPDNCDDCGG